MTSTVTVMVVGDLVLLKPDPAFYFEPSSAVLRSADLAIGQIEVPYSHSTDVAAIAVPSPSADPHGLAAIAAAGISIGTVAGNHVFDTGTQGVAETVEFCRQAGITPVGAGSNLDQARQPAIVERAGLRIGVLSYNCVGPRESWATTRKAGSAYVKVLTHYDLDDLNPGAQPTTYTFCEPVSFRAMRSDVEKLSRDVDVSIVVFHKGAGHTPAVVLDYERELAHAAIDSGASAVVGHHAHILRGIEFYHGRPIFHGLGNFVTVLDVLTPGTGGNSAELEQWTRKRRELYGFAPDPDMPSYPFHPESRNTAIAVFDIDGTGDLHSRVIPCWIDDDGRPIPLNDEPQGRRVGKYIESISQAVGFDTTFEWMDGQLHVRPPRDRHADPSSGGRHLTDRLSVGR